MHSPSLALSPTLATTTHWVHDLSPFVIQFSDTFGLRYYGLAYVLGFGGCWWLLTRFARAGRTKLSSDQIGDLLTFLVLGVLVGGRLGYFLFYQPATLLRDPLELLRIWDGGMASHGGFLGVAAALFWFARRHQVAWLHLGDLIAASAGFGLLLGRLANFINGELWGKVSQVPWAVIFPASGEPGVPVELIAPRHPSQLYAAALEGLALLLVTQWLAWRTPLLRNAPGRLAGWFLLGYAAARSIGELFREPDASLLFGLSRGTFYSIFVALAGLYLLLRRPNAGNHLSPAD